MKHSYPRKALAILLCLAMVFCYMPLVASAATFTDTQNHWGQSDIDQWSGYDVIKGNPDGSFGPDDLMTRGQAASAFAELFNLPMPATVISHPDVPAGSWLVQPVAKVENAKIMQGVGGGLINPNGFIKREDFFLMLGRGLGIKEQATTGGAPADGSAYSTGMINALTDKGFVKGDGTGVNALANINRASVMALFSQTITTYANKPGQTVNAEGKGVVLVVADDVTVKGEAGLVVVGNTEGTKGVTLDGVKTDQLSVVGGAEVAMAGDTKVDAVVITESAEGSDLTVGANATAGTIESAADNATIENKGTVTGAIATTGENADVKNEGKAGAISTSGAGSDVKNTGSVSGDVTAAGAVDNTGKVEGKVTDNTAAGTATPGTTEQTTEPTTGGGSSSGHGGSKTVAVSGVGKANMTARVKDNASEEMNLPPGFNLDEGYNVSATKPKNGDGSEVDVKVTTTKLYRHYNANNQPGFWVGFAIAAPEGATHYQYALEKEDGATASGTAELGSGEKTVDVYSRAEGWQGKTEATKTREFTISWYAGDPDSSGELIGQTVTYKADFTGVKMTPLVTFDPNGGAAVPGNMVVALGDTYTPSETTTYQNADTLAGLLKTFAGWTRGDEDFTSGVISGPIELKAKWTDGGTKAVVTKNMTVNQDIDLTDDKWVIVETGATLTIAAGKTLTVGKLDNYGTLENKGTLTVALSLINEGTIENRGTITTVLLDNSEGNFSCAGAITAETITDVKTSGIVLVGDAATLKEKLESSAYDGVILCKEIAGVSNTIEIKDEKILDLSCHTVTGASGKCVLKVWGDEDAALTVRGVAGSKISGSSLYHVICVYSKAWDPDSYGTALTLEGEVTIENTSAGDFTYAGGFGAAVNVAKGIGIGAQAPGQTDAPEVKATVTIGRDVTLTPSTGGKALVFNLEAIDIVGNDVDGAAAISTAQEGYYTTNPTSFIDFMCNLTDGRTGTGAKAVIEHDGGAANDEIIVGY